MHDRLKEERKVFTCSCRDSWTKSGIKSIDTLEEGRGEGHTDSGAKLSRCIRMQGYFRVMLCHIKDTAAKILAKSAVFLEPELCRSFKFQG